MGFDAGSITGSLTLDLGSFLASLNSAEGSAGQFDHVVQQSLVASAQQAAQAINEAAARAGVSFAEIAEAAESTVNPIHDAAQASNDLGESLSSLRPPVDGASESTEHASMSLEGLTSSQKGASASAEGLKGSMAEGGAEAGGPYAAAILAVVEVGRAAIDVLKELGEAVKEMTIEVGNAEAELSLMAEKAGVPIEQFSKLAKVSEVVGVHAEQLGSAFKFLQKNAVEAVEGDDKLIQGFKDLGISTDFLNEHLDDSAALFTAVQAGMDGLGSNAERAKAAIQILGKQGSDLLPLFDMSSEAIERVSADMVELGAVDDEAAENSARTWKLLETYIGAAWEGIKKAVAEPILNYLAAHIDEIIPKIIELSGLIRDGIAEAFKIVAPIAEGLWHVVQAIAGAVGEALLPTLHDIKPTLEDIGKIMGELLNQLAEFINKITEAEHRFHQFAGVVSPLSTFAVDHALFDGKAPASYSSIANTEKPKIDVHIHNIFGDGQTAHEIGEKVHKKLKEAKAEYARNAHQERTAKGVRGGKGIGGSIFGN